MSKSSIKKNIVFNAIKTFSTIVFPLITFPYVSRVLQPENIGKVNFAMSFVSYFALIASLGISTYAIRECSRVRDDRNKLGKTASEIFSINIWTTLMSYVLLFVTMLLFSKFDNYRTLIIIQSTTILFTTLGTDWLNSAMEDFKFITIRTMLFQVLSLCLMFIFVREPSDYIKYASISVIANSGANIVNIWYRKKYCKVSFVKEIDWKRHMAPILALFVMALSQTIFSSADVTMLGLFKGDFEVGLYSTAHKIETIISQIVSTLVFVLMPRLSYLFGEGDYTKINALLRKVLGMFLTLGIPCYVGATVLSEEIVLLIAGEEYMAAAPVFQTLMLSFLFSLVGGSFLGNIVLLTSGKEKQYMIICCIATAINVITNAIFIPTYGAYAAACTTAFSSFAILLMLLASTDKRIRFEKKSKIFLPPIVGSVLMGVYCMLAKSAISNLYIRILACVIGGVVVYGIAELVMKNEIVNEIMQKVLSKLKGSNHHE